MSLRLLAKTVAVSTALAAAPASAATFVVEALTHSINGGGGGGLNTALVFAAGQQITVSSSTNDLWSAGSLPRYSDGSGLTGDRFKTAADDADPSIANGTLIGQQFSPFPTFNGFTAPFGSLVGRYGDGTYQLFGANFSGAAAGSGALTLFYWDGFTPDNFGEITFDIAAVPEPAAWAMMIMGFGVIGGALRLRRRTTVTYA